MLKWCCLTSSDRGLRKFKVKMETSGAEPVSGLSRGFLMYWCHQSNYTATHELSQVHHLWEWVLSINLTASFIWYQVHAAARAEFQIELDLRVTSWKCHRGHVCGAESTHSEILQHWVSYQLCHLMHLFTSCLLNTCHAPGPIQGSWHITENQTDKVSSLVELIFSREVLQVGFPRKILWEGHLCTGSLLERTCPLTSQGERKEERLRRQNRLSMGTGDSVVSSKVGMAFQNSPLLRWKGPHL